MNVMCHLRHLMPHHEVRYLVMRHATASLTQGRQNPQRGGRLHDPARRPGHDQSWITHHAHLDRKIIIDAYSAEDRTDRCTEEQDLFISLIEDVVETQIGLDLLCDVITGGEIPDHK